MPEQMYEIFWVQATPPKGVITQVTPPVRSSTRPSGPIRSARNLVPEKNSHLNRTIALRPPGSEGNEGFVYARDGMAQELLKAPAPVVMRLELSEADSLPEFNSHGLSLRF